MKPIVRCVFGKRGSGKTTLARALADDAPRVLAFDPLGEGDWGGRPGWRTTTTRDALKRAIVAGVAAGAYRIAYTPDARSTDPVTEAGFLADAARAAQAAYADDGVPLLLVIDEANLAFPVDYARTARCAALRALILQGRHRGVGLLFVTQRPANIGVDARSQAAETYAFRLALALDKRAVAELHPDAERRLQSLAEFHFLRISDAGCCVGTTRRGRLIMSAKAA